MRLTPVDEVVVRGLANRYRHPGIGAPLAAATEPIVSERGIQVAPRMKLPMTADQPEQSRVWQPIRHDAKQPGAPNNGRDTDFPWRPCAFDHCGCQQWANRGQR